MKFKVLIPIYVYLLLNVAYAENKNGVYEFDVLKGLQSLEVEATKGNLLIEAGSQYKAMVEVKKVKWGKGCEESVVQFGPTLTVKIKGSGILSKTECLVDLKIKVPKSVDLDISNGSMNTTVEGIEGNLNYKSATGELKARGEFLKVDLKVANSDVFIDGMTGDGNLIGAAADMKIVYTKCPMKNSKLSLSRASGDVEIFAPKNCKLKTQNKSASGESFNEFGDTMDYNLEVSSVSASGDFKLKKLK